MKAIRYLGDLLGLVAVGLALWLIAAAADNRRAQAELVERAQTIERARTLANVNNGLIQLLARTSAETGDPALRALLAQNGVQFQLRPGPQVAPAPPAPGAQ